MMKGKVKSKRIGQSASKLPKLIFWMKVQRLSLAREYWYILILKSIYMLGNVRIIFCIFV